MKYRISFSHLNAKVSSIHHWFLYERSAEQSSTQSMPIMQLLLNVDCLDSFPTRIEPVQ